jgi:antirestriction protein ArdC
MGTTGKHPVGGEGKSSLYQEVTDRIVAELEQGRVPWVQPWGRAKAGLGLPKNASTGRQYSGVNILILWGAVIEKGFASQHWLTFRQTALLA